MKTYRLIPVCFILSEREIIMNINKEELNNLIKEYLNENMKIDIDFVDKDGGYNSGKVHTVKIFLGEELICSNSFSLEE